VGLADDGTFYRDVLLGRKQLYYRSNDFNSIGEQISYKWTASAAATAVVAAGVRPTCCRHLGHGDVILLPVLRRRRLLPEHRRGDQKAADLRLSLGRRRFTSGLRLINSERAGSVSTAETEMASNGRTATVCSVAVTMWGDENDRVLT